MDEDARKVAEIVDWFKRQGVDLAFDQVGDAWAALMMPEGQRIGSAHAAHGDTKREAAENARALRERRPNPGSIDVSPGGDVNIHPPTAGAVVEGSGSGEVRTSGHAVGQVVTDEAKGEDHAEVLREAERKAVEFGWRLGYAREPDDSFTWIVFDAESGEALQSGNAPTWDDARLEAISNLFPPSGEK